ncbi:MAG TPA: hypothetical protein VJP78_14875 [Thermoleophilia bacterium]|nr:hypothetical protein [Thermoleophilia bacterium]
MIEELRSKIEGEEFDHQTLLDTLAAYRKPRDAITRLLRAGAIIRVKKGLYVFGPVYARRPFSRPLLANLIYGPSYVSLEYALQYYGLIPEHVQAVTSATVSRAKRFNTPVGLFTYRMVPSEGYWTGVDRVETAEGVPVLMATREKAIADKVRDDRGTGIGSLNQMSAYLLDDLRIDKSELSVLDANQLEEIGRLYRSRKVALLAGAVRLHYKGRGGELT